MSCAKCGYDQVSVGKWPRVGDTISCPSCGGKKYLPPMSKPPIEIDIRSRSHDVDFHARLAWQELFNIYRENGGNLSAMDSLLCDLSVIAQRLRESLRNEVVFYWHFGRGGLTDITDTNEGDESACKVVFDDERQTIVIGDK